MKNEDRKTRRGEPILFEGRPGTIEWGDDEHGYSLYMERGGRIQVSPHATSMVVSDPGGERPTWRGVSR